MSKILLFVVLLFSASMLQASPLDDARNAGHITELPTGYVQASGSAPAQVKALAADVNKRRKEAYAQIAKKNGISVEQVGMESYKKRAGELTGQ